MKRLVAPLLFFGAWGLLQACGGDDNGGSGTEPTVTITAPNIVSPASGSQVSETRPTLTVTNVTVSNGTTPTYNFQVATDSGFTSIVAQTAGVGQGSGQTSWQVNTDLPSSQFFWRARADVGATQGPYSAVADFAVTGGAQPGDIVVINDPLTDGTTQAVTVGGGTFTPRGWRINNNADFLRYEVDAISNGFVMWTNYGLTPRGATADSHMLFGMWDPTAGGFRANNFRVNVQKLWGPTHNPPYVRLRWISGGRLEDAGMNFTDWDPGQPYTWRVQWGPAAGAHTARVFLDGVEILQVRYNRPYLPNTHFIEFGIQERGESVIDAVYSNILIGRNQ
jgi:hypothetical protein